MMAPEEMAAVLQAPNQLCYCVCFFSLFVTYFLHNVSATVSATVSYDQKELLDIRTAITHLVLDKDFFFRSFVSELDMKDLLQTPDKAQIPIIRMKKRRRYRGRRSGCFARIRQWVSNHPLPSVLLTNVQSLDNKMDELRSRLSYQWDIKNCNILCFTKLWLNDVLANIELAVFSVHRGLFVNNSWCWY